MKEFEHFTVCYACLSIMGENPCFSFKAPMTGRTIDLCNMCIGEIVTKISPDEVISFAEQRSIEKEREEQRALMEGDEWDEDQKRKLEEQAKDRIK